MEWPTDILVKVIEVGTNRPKENIVVYIVLVASRKNNYSFGPFSTDERGETKLSSKEIRQWIATAKEEFPMDYVDDLEQCRKIIVELESAESLRERASKISRFYPDEERRLRRLLGGNANLLPKKFSREFVPSKGETLVLNITV